MKHFISPRHTYIEWISPQEMHEEALSWISQLKFARDEQKFLNKLVKSYTLQLTDHHIFNKSSKIAGALSDYGRSLLPLMKEVQSHENLLEVMLDDIDEPKKEKAYKDTHRELTGRVAAYMTEYRDLKKSLFTLLSRVMKKEKQKRLLT